ncbi:MAG: hypothetical protein H0X17_05160 [Deltaproteobacteria bacterium]|nr:hypothetical protein [Deltaproteobacteria bacterium]
MKTLLSLFSAVSLVAACGGDDSGLTGDDAPPPDAAPSPDSPPGSMIIDVPGGDLTGDITWEAGNTYVLKGYVFMTGGTLTIEPGTVVKGDNGSALTITKDAKLNAVGTAAKPIVFTSSTTPATPGSWGGVVLLGKAPINVVGGTNAIEGFPTSYGERIVYGAATPNAAHDCGKLKYARIEYAGFLLSPDNELNGLTVGGCGSATQLDYIQVHLGQDDGVEMFGGTANLSHLVISHPDDDGLDWDRGWTGKVQFLVVAQKAGRGDKAVEADNNNNDNELTPRSAPEIWNATFIGADGAAADPQGGLHLRRGTAGKINNAIVAYFTKFAVDVDGASSTGQFGTGLAIKNTYFLKGANATALWPANFDGAGAGNDGGFDEAAQIGGDATNRMNVDPQLTAPKNATAPSWKPATGSPVLTGCGTPPAGLDTTATFCGAIGADDWTVGWTAFPG